MSRLYLTSCSFALLFIPTAMGQNAAKVQRVQRGTTYICWTNHTLSEPSTLYHSGVFTTAPNTSLATLTDAWNNSLRNTYPQTKFDSGSCDDQLSDPTGRLWVQNIEPTVKARKEQVVTVNWKYMPGKDTTPPPPPQAAGKSTKTYYCSGGMINPPYTEYYSDTFVASESLDTYKVRDDFLRFLKGKYGPDVSTRGCSSEDKAKKQADMKEAHRAIVETGWKPQSLPETKRRAP